MSHTIFFNTRDELTRVDLDDVMYASNDGNYINLHLRSGRFITLLASLQNFLQATQSVSGVRFRRVGRSHIINTAYISQVNCLRKTVRLADDDTCEQVELSVPKEATRQLKRTFTDMPRTTIPDFQTENGNMEAFKMEENIKQPDDSVK